MVPDNVDSFRYSCRPHFANYFVQTDGSHVVEFIATNYFRGKFDKLISEPRWTGSGGPEILHMIENEAANGRVPRFKHTWSCT